MRADELSEEHPPRERRMDHLAYPKGGLRKPKGKGLLHKQRERLRRRRADAAQFEAIKGQI